ncbi:L-serine ammonia-lyase, iron-sulfur-dependent, subunit alpha [Lachnospiraceae bacterium OttesenSCG-928-D06]|nr:L-serine ammonia-lyase, iron-sulfur-dependent, subunit alpha [Lachnospiraceae bacterium OttesenSCG-928-D06]
MAYDSLAEILRICKEEQKEFWQVVLTDDVLERDTTEKESMEKMTSFWEAMCLARDSYDGSLCSSSGLSGGDGQKMQDFYSEQQVDSIGGSFLSKVIVTALKMGESNACMKRIVAAPTAGACGVLPAVLIPYEEEKQIEKEEIIKALYVAAGIGKVIASRAYISGASGGCQAEIGSASAMAAGALAYLQGGDGEAITHAAAMSMKNLLGLVCDPVAGLVEIPCIKRNVIGAMSAISAADMAVAGIKSRIPPDQVMDAMKEIGDKMHDSLRETAEGGLAMTGAGREISNRLSNSLSDFF